MPRWGTKSVSKRNLVDAKRIKPFRADSQSNETKLEEKITNSVCFLSEKKNISQYQRNFFSLSQANRTISKQLNTFLYEKEKIKWDKSQEKKSRL